MEQPKNLDFNRTYVGVTPDIKRDKPKFASGPLYIPNEKNKKYSFDYDLTKEQALKVQKETGIALPENKNGTYNAILGSGNFGIVCVCEDLRSGKLYAVKKIKYESKIKQCEQEVKIQKELTEAYQNKVSNLLPIVDSITVNDEFGEPTELYLFFPIIAHDLEDLMTNLKSLQDNPYNNQLKLLFCAHVIRGVLAGIKQMHNLDIYHLDLKSGNILIDRKGKVIVSDFGVAAKVDTLNDHAMLSESLLNDHHKYGQSDPTYKPPERRNNPNSPFDCKKIDIYLVGTILYELLMQERFEYKKSYDHSVFKSAQGLAKELADLCLKLLEEDPNKRLGLKEALDHPALKINFLLLVENMTSLPGKDINDKKSNEFISKLLQWMNPVENNRVFQKMKRTTSALFIRKGDEKNNNEKKELEKDKIVLHQLKRQGSFEIKFGSKEHTSKKDPSNNVEFSNSRKPTNNIFDFFNKKVDLSDINVDVNSPNVTSVQEKTNINKEGIELPKQQDCQFT